jgi:hypothetical protein
LAPSPSRFGFPRPSIDKYVSELAGGGGALVAAATPNALPPGEFMIGPRTDSAAVEPIDPARCLHPARRLHALTFGHGRLLAAYLVGGQGAPRQAITLGVVIIPAGPSSDIGGSPVTIAQARRKLVD